MELTKYKIGELIELTNEKNANGLYGEDDAIGVNIDKIIMPMRGNLEKKDFSNFHLVPPRHFAYNPRGSRKLGIGFNDTEKTFIITFNDNVFRIKETAKKKILDTYLFMYLCRKEWDRYAEFISWGSSTEVFDWNIFCEEEIFLPPIQIQQKYVDVYNAMLENQKSYEHGLDDLKLSFEALLDEYKHKVEKMPIGSLLKEVDNRNMNGLIKNVQGINITTERVMKSLVGEFTQNEKWSVKGALISEITDSVLEQLEEWQNRPLKRFYTFLFVDCLYVAIRKDYETKNYAVYVILGYDVDGQKDILGLWLSESESKHQWMQIFDELKNRGVEDVLFLSMDGVSGLEEGAKAIFPHVTVQRCIVHLIRNSIKYVPNKDYKRFTAQLKKVYGAASLKAAESEFERFRQAWSQYPGAVDVWVRNWQHVAQLFSYGSAVRKILYTTNAVESVNSSFRKVTKKGAFPNENALLKLLYLRINELYKKWNRRSQSNWALVRNQLDMDEKIQERIRKYENGGF